MIDIETACEIATKHWHEPFVSFIIDIGRGYVIGTTFANEECEGPLPILVDKNSGKSEVFFIFVLERFNELRNGVEIDIPTKFKYRS